MKRILSGFVLLPLTAGTAFGHPGHGHPEVTDGVWHYLTAPAHAVVAASVLTIVVCSSVIALRNLLKRSRTSGDTVTLFARNR